MSNSNQSNRILWIIAGIISIAVGVCALIGYFIYPSMKSGKKPDAPAVAQAVSAPASEATPAQKPSSEAVATTLTPSSEAIAATLASSAPIGQSKAEFQALVKADLLSQPVPSDAALAREELHKLTDIEKQLKQQKDLLEKQNLSADELIKLKEQQIYDLEQQLRAS